MPDKDAKIVSLHEKLRHRSVKPVHVSDDPGSIFVYPPRLKELSLQILELYRDLLKEQLGRKTVGWTIVRNIIMKELDARHADGFDPRLHRDDLEKWASGHSVIGDEKFKFVDYFVKSQEIDQRFDGIRAQIVRYERKERLMAVDLIFGARSAVHMKRTPRYALTIEQLCYTYWLSDPMESFSYKRFITYIGELNGYALSTLTVFFPYVFSFEDASPYYQGAFSASGALIMEPYFSMSSTAGLPARSPESFFDTLTGLLFKSFDVGGDNGSISTGLFHFQEYVCNIGWGRPITTPHNSDYLTLATHQPQRIANPVAKPHPLSVQQDSNIYIGGMGRVKNDGEIEVAQSIFSKFDLDF